jgi:hypothetical protein
MRRPSRATLLGLAGLAIIAANVGQKVWQALGAPATPTTPTIHVCAAVHYKLTTNRCTQDDYILTVRAAGRAYVVSDVPDPANAINAFQVVQLDATGTTITIANRATRSPPPSTVRPRSRPG